MFNLHIMLQTTPVLKTATAINDYAGDNPCGTDGRDKVAWTYAGAPDASYTIKIDRSVNGGAFVGLVSGLAPSGLSYNDVFATKYDAAGGINNNCQYKVHLRNLNLAEMPGSPITTTTVNRVMKTCLP